MRVCVCRTQGGRRRGRTQEGGGGAGRRAARRVSGVHGTRAARGVGKHARVVGVHGVARHRGVRGSEHQGARCRGGSARRGARPGRGVRRASCLARQRRGSRGRAMAGRAVLARQRGEGGGRRKEKEKKENGKRKRKREREIALAPIAASGGMWPTGSRAARDETAARKRREGTVGGKRKRWNNDRNRTSGRRKFWEGITVQG